MEQQNQPLLWNSYSTQPSLGYYSYNQPGYVSTLYSTLEPSSDRDEFFIGSSYCAVRMEQATEDPIYQVGAVVTSDPDDTMAPGLDPGLEDEETADVTHVLPEDSAARFSDFRFQQLESEVEHLRRENQELLERINSQVVQPYGYNNEFGSGTDVEEVIEEEHRTVHHNRPTLARYDESVQYAGPMTKTVGVGNFNVNRYHIIDLQSEAIDRSQFPPDYWSRLEHIFESRHNVIRPPTRDVAFQSLPLENRTIATMVTPNSTRERQCVGVTVRPMTHDIGVSCGGAPTREFGCITPENDVIGKEWIDKNLADMSEQNRNIVTRIMKSSSKSHEEFVESILKVLRKDGKSVGIETKPDVRTSFTTTATLNDELVTPVSASLPTRPLVLMESQVVEARPLLLNKSVMTVRMVGISATTETDSALMRSQGTQAEYEIPEVTACGVQTDPCPKIVESSVDPLQADELGLTVSAVQTSNSLEKFDPSVNPKSHAAPSSDRPSHDYDISATFSPQPQSISSDTKSDFAGRSSRIGSVFSHSIHLQASRPMSPEEIRELFPTYFGPSSRSTKSVPDNAGQYHPEDEPITAGPIHADGYTVSSERRLVDEQSVRRLLPEGLDLNELARNEWITVDNMLSKAKTLGSSHFVREFQPTIEIVHHADEADPSVEQRHTTEFILRIPVEDRDAKSAPTGESLPVEKVHTVPVVSSTHSPRTDQGTEEYPIVPIVGRRVSEGSDTAEPSGATLAFDESVRSLSEIHTGTDADKPGTEDVPIHSTHGQTTQLGEFSHLHKTRTSRLPLRNNSFVMPKETARACQVLGDYYRSGRSSDQDPVVQTELTKVTNLWFELTTSTTASLAELEDFLATLHQYHEQLVRDVIQSTDDQGLTSLHLAVGHGAWPVVNLILDSGHAEPDRLNRAGYSPIMIAAFGTATNSAALATLNRLFGMGDVNLHSAGGSGQTALMLAAQNHAVDVFELLLMHHAQVNAQDKAGNTALMFAIQHGDRDLVSLLLDRPELDLFLQDNRGKDALNIAMRRGDPSIIHWIRSAMTGRSHQSSVYAEAPASKVYRKRHVHEILHQLRHTHLQNRSWLTMPSNLSNTNTLV